MISGISLVVIAILLYLFISMSEEETYLRHNKEIYKANTIRFIRYTLAFIMMAVVLILLALKL